MRLEAHLREGPAPHIFPEDDDQLEENPVEDTPYTPDTEEAFLALLQAIDSSSKDNPQPLTKIHYHAMSHLPLTYPWVSLVLDLKEVLPVYDHHLTASLGLFRGGDREGGGFGRVMMDKISAQDGGYVDTEVGNFHADVFFVGDPMHELVTDQPFRPALFSRKLRASVIKMGVPEGLSVKFSLVKEWRGIVSVLRTNDVENELSQLVKEVKQDGPWVRGGTSSRVIGY